MSQGARPLEKPSAMTQNHNMTVRTATFTVINGFVYVVVVASNQIWSLSLKMSLQMLTFRVLQDYLYDINDSYNDKISWEIAKFTTSL